MTIYDLQLPEWLQSVDVIGIVAVLQRNKQMTSMQVFHELEKSDPLLVQKFVAFSKLLCKTLPASGIIAVQHAADGIMYTIPNQKLHKVHKMKE